MSITVTMPQLGESVREGTIGTWLVQPGQEVAKFDSLVEVITDKVTAEVPSPAAGKVSEILASEGQLLAVGEPLCVLEGDAADADGAAEPAAGAPEVAAAPTAAPVEAPPIPQPPAPPASVLGPGAAPAPSGFISPAVAALARERGIDLSQVPGTGFEGRITKRDVLFFSERPAAAPEAPAKPSAAEPAPVAAPGDRVPLSPMRRAIAEHMVRSRQVSPHAWTMMEVDMSGVTRSRAAHREQFRRVAGVDLTLLPYAMEATCLALRAVPSMNAVLEGDTVVLQREINLGLAVSVPDGLMVPVVRGADQLSLAGLARAAAELIARARAGKARLEDLEGGTFTLNNAGALGTVMSQAIINQPQAAILVMDSVVRRPVVVGDAIAIRPLMNLCLSFDHRLNDGAAAAHLLAAVKGWLESVDENTPTY